MTRYYTVHVPPGMEFVPARIIGPLEPGVEFHDTEVPGLELSVTVTGAEFVRAWWALRYGPQFLPKISDGLRAKLRARLREVRAEWEQGGTA